MALAEFMGRVILTGMGILLLGFLGIAQPGNVEKAEDYFAKGNYSAAIAEYIKLLKTDSLHAEYNHQVGLCYLRSNFDKEKAVFYMQRASTQPNRSPEILLDLALALMSLMQYDHAEKKLTHYREVCSPKEFKKIDDLVAGCEAAKELMKNPLSVDIVDLGPNINSKYPDYYPFLTKNGKKLVFTSRREENFGAKVEFDGFYSSDIWISEQVNGEWQPAVNAGKKVNTYLDEQCVGLSDDGSVMYVYLDHIDEFGDIHTSTLLPEDTYGPRQLLGTNVNSKKLETSCSLSSDGQTLFFASEQDGTMGGRDIFMSRRLPDQTWGFPQSLGPIVNTTFNEDFPTLSNDNKTLFFSSNGHPGMGGYDLYYSTWDPHDNKWTEPINIGYPINTPGDNRTISFDEDGSTAVISDYWKGKGLGDFDIYSVTFKEHTANLATILLTLADAGSFDPVQQNAQMDFFSQNDELIASFRPNKKTGEFLVVLNPGTYMLSIVADDLEEFTESFVVTEGDTEQPMVIKKLSLKR